MPTYVGELGIDWADCPLVEVNPLKLSGVPILRKSRIQADAIVENYEGGSPISEIAENFGLAEDLIHSLLDYASRHRPALAS